MVKKGVVLSKEEVRRMARLSRISLTTSEEERFTEQLNTILTYFRKMDKVETDSVPPTYHVIDLVNVVRKDVTQTFPSDGILKAAPKKKGRLIKAPRIT